MGVIGTSGGGYATVLPTQGNPIGDAMANVENSAFRYSAQKMAKERMKQDAERDLYDRRRQEFADAQLFSKDNPFVATGTGIDGSNMQSYNNAKDSASNSRNEYNKTGDPKYLAAYQNAVSSAKAISEMPKQLNALKESWDSAPEVFNQESLKNKKAIIDKLNNGQIVQSNDENGRPKYSLFERDDNGNITKVVKKEMNAAELKKLLEAVPNFNIDGTEGMKGDSLVKTFNENIGKERKTTVIKNGKEVETTFNPGSEDLAKIMANEAVLDKNKVYNIFTRLGINAEDDNSYTPENIEKARAYIEDKLIASAPKTVSEKPNYEAIKIAQTDRSQAETARHNRAMENKADKDKEKVVLGETPSVLKNITIDKVGLPNNTYSYPLGGMMLGKEGKGTVATNIFVSPNGKMRLKIESVGYDGDSKEVYRLTEEGQKNVNTIKNYEPKASDYETVRVSDKNPKVRILDFGKDATEISRYAKEAGLTVSQLTKKYISLYEEQSGKKFPRPNKGPQNNVIAPKKENSKAKPKAIQFDAQGNIIM